MYIVNKIVGALVNPLAIGLIAFVVACILLGRGRKRWGWWVFAFGAAWLWLWSTPVAGDLIGLDLERDWPPQLAENAPSADAIILLGGGMNSATNVVPYANIGSAADRVWHAARLYKAGKAPIIIATGYGAPECERMFLLDLGVPQEAIVCEEEARNTEENARHVAEMLKKDASPSVKPKVLLVTSAWHMRRAKLMYDRYAPDLDIIPIPCDHETTIFKEEPLTIGSFLPNVGTLHGNTIIFKEILGYWGYRIFRR